jgi:hypothetical protein
MPYKDHSKAVATAVIRARKRRAIARTHIAAVRVRTVCKDCGKQPIEWHSFKHDKNSRLRISVMPYLGQSLAAIDTEIAKCEPLCRDCHQDRHKVKAPCKRCKAVGRHHANGLCKRCYDKQRR